MKKIKSRLLTSLLAATLVVSSFSAFNASAVLRVNDSEKLSQEMGDSGYVYIPEAIDDFAYIIGGNADTEKMDNGLWFVDGDSDLMWFGYKQVIDDYAIFYFDISSEDYSAVVDELKAEIGYDDKINIQVRNENRYDEEIKSGVRKDVGIIIRFSENGTDLNYMIAEKAVSTLQEKFDVTQSKISIGRASVDNMRIIMQACPVKTVDDAEAFTDEQLEDFNNILDDNDFEIRCHRVDDETLKELNEYYGTDRKARFLLDIPENTTVQEKLRYVAFVQKNYDSTPSLYSLATVKQASEVFDILETENKYNQGDANEDGKVNMADVTAIVQAIGNPDKYALTPQGSFNADTDSDGITGMDALEIQMKVAEAGIPE